jgi:hypothetical protein
MTNISKQKQALTQLLMTHGSTQLLNLKAIQILTVTQMPLTTI